MTGKTVKEIESILAKGAGGPHPAGTCKNIIYPRPKRWVGRAERSWLVSVAYSTVRFYDGIVAVFAEDPGEVLSVIVRNTPRKEWEAL